MTATQEQIERVKRVVSWFEARAARLHRDAKATANESEGTANDAADDMDREAQGSTDDAAALDALLREREELLDTVSRLRVLIHRYDSELIPKRDAALAEAQLQAERSKAIVIDPGTTEDAKRPWLREVERLRRKLSSETDAKVVAEQKALRANEQLAEAQREIERIKGLCGPAGDGTAFGRVESVLKYQLSRVAELEAQLQAAKADASFSAYWQGEAERARGQLAASEEARKRAEEKLSVAETEGDSHWERARLLARDVDTTKKRAEAAEARVSELEAQLPELKPGGPREPDNSMVICPNCTHQFRAISEDDQKYRSELEAQLQAIRARALPATCHDCDYCINPDDMIPGCQDLLYPTLRTVKDRLAASEEARKRAEAEANKLEERLMADLSVARIGTRVMQQRAEAAEAQLKRFREALRNLFVNHSRPADNGDWACAECRPQSDMIRKGFRCAYHEAYALLLAEADKGGKR